MHDFMPKSTAPVNKAIQDWIDRQLAESPAWLPASEAPEGVIVDTKIDDEQGARNFQPLKRDGNLWWIPGAGMYVYYRPTHYRPCTEEK